MRLCLIDFAAVLRSFIFSFAATECIMAHYSKESVSVKTFKFRLTQEVRKRVMNFFET